MWAWKWEMNSAINNSKNLVEKLDIVSTQKYKTQLWIAWAKIAGKIKYWPDWVKEKKANFIENNNWKIHIVDEKEWVVIFKHKSWVKRLWKILVSDKWAELVEKKTINFSQKLDIELNEYCSGYEMLSDNLNNNYEYESIELDRYDDTKNHYVASIKWFKNLEKRFIDESPIVYRVYETIKLEYKDWKFIPVVE